MSLIWELLRVYGTMNLGIPGSLDYMSVSGVYSPKLVRTTFCGLRQIRHVNKDTATPKVPVLVRCECVNQL